MEIESKIKFDGKNFYFYYKSGASDWLEFYTFTAGKYLSTRVHEGYVGNTIGMFAASSGKPPPSNAVFHILFNRR